MSASSVDGLRRLRSPIALSATAKTAEAVPLVLLVTVVPRVLGPTEYGWVALAVTLVTLGSASVSLGGPVLLTRFIPAADPGDRLALARALARRLALWRIIQAALVVALAVAVAVALPGTFPPLPTLLVAVALVLDVGATLCFQVGLALGRARPWAFRYAFQSTVLVLAVLVLAAVGGPQAPVAGVTIAAAAALVLGAATVARPLSQAPHGARIPPAFMRFGVLQGASGLFVELLHRGGVIAVALLAGSTRETGFAGLTIGLALAATYAVWQVFVIQLPWLAEVAAGDLGAAETAAERLAWKMLLLVAPAAIAGALLTPALPLLAGERFRDAETALGPALALIPLALLSALVAQVAALRLRPQLRLLATALGAAVFAVVAAATIPYIGATGATTALLAGTLCSALMGIVLLPGAASLRVASGSVMASGLVLAISLLGSSGVMSMSLAVDSVALVIALALGVLLVRRVILLCAALAPTVATRTIDAAAPSLTVLVAAQDEESRVERMLDAFERMEYPRDRLQIVLIDDGSTDGTGEIFERWARRHVNVASVLRLPRRLGKADALNAGLATSDASELVIVCDADQQLRPDCLVKLTSIFSDTTLGAAGAYLRPQNANASMVARYAAVETWVTQLITSAARSRLDLNPPTLGGGSMYRRRALEEIGGFPHGFAGEDVAATIAITRNGWRTRFVREAVVDNVVVDTWRRYWIQHVRWARSGYQTVRLQRGGADAPLGRRVEAWMVSAGYADRLVLLGGLAFVAVGALPLWIPGVYLGAIGLEVVAAVALGGSIRRLPWYLVATAALGAVDAAATLVATVAHLRRRPLRWGTLREGDADPEEEQDRRARAS